MADLTFDCPICAQNDLCGEHRSQSFPCHDICRWCAEKLVAKSCPQCRAPMLSKEQTKMQVLRQTPLYSVNQFVGECEACGKKWSSSQDRMTGQRSLEFGHRIVKSDISAGELYICLECEGHVFWMSAGNNQVQTGFASDIIWLA